MITEGLACLICLLFGYIFYKSFIRPHSYWRRKRILQGPSVWIFGESWKNLLRQESFAESVMRIYRKFPATRYFGTYQFNTPILVVRDTELIKQIAIKDFEYFEDHRVFIPESVDPLWGTNLFSLRGQRWKNMRILLSPAFTSRKMKNMFKLMKDAAEVFVKYFKEKQEDIIELDFKDTLNRFTCDVIATTAFGIEVNSLKVPKNEFYEIGMEFTDFTGWRSLLFFMFFILPSYVMKYCGIRIFSGRVTKFFTRIVDETINIREEKGIIRPDMIHLLMEARKGRHAYEEENTIDTGYATAKTSSYFTHKITSKVDVSNSDIAAQAAVFFFGGFDTVSTEMRLLVYELAVRPDIQNKLRQEINETFDNCQGILTYEGLMKMNYMDMVISETLRKWPSGIILERICTKSYTIPALHPDETDIIIEKGTLIWIPVIGLHHDPQYYSDPEKFNPERFSGLNRDQIHLYAYLPFGIGPRNCIGSRYAIMKMKVMFFHLLREFEIIPIEKSKIPVKFSRKNFSLDGNCFWFGLKKLNTN